MRQPMHPHTSRQTPRPMHPQTLPPMHRLLHRLMHRLLHRLQHQVHRQVQSRRHCRQLLVLRAISRQLTTPGLAYRVLQAPSPPKSLAVTVSSVLQATINPAAAPPTAPIVLRGGMHQKKRQLHANFALKGSTTKVAATESVLASVMILTTRCLQSQLSVSCAPLANTRLRVSASNARAATSPVAPGLQYARLATQVSFAAQVSDLP
jgi:hypothetical protein